MAESKASIDKNFSQQVERLQTASAAQSAIVAQVPQVAWDMPVLGSWNGNLTDVTNLGIPFDNTALKQQFASILTNPQDLGVDGDIRVIQTMNDDLMTMQRAFRARHLTPVRAHALAAVRRQFHGQDRGPWGKSHAAYVQSLLEAAKQ